MNIRSIILIILSTLIIYFIFKKFVLGFFKKINELYRLRRYGKTSEGIIVDYEVNKDSDGMVTYLPIITYQTSEKEIKVLLQYPLKEKPILGSKIMVYFDDQNPEIAVIDIEQAFFRNYLGLFFLVLTIALIIFFTIKVI